MTAARGIVCNDGTADAVSALNPQWLHIEWGEWCYDPANVLPCDWVIHLYYHLPAVEDLRRAVQHPNYSGQWMLGKNEPDLIGAWTPGQQFDLIQQQMALVQQADPEARFAIEGGSQYHPIWETNASGNPNSYFYKVWKKFTPQQQTAIRAIHFHYYAQAEIFPPADLSQIWTPDPIVNYFSQVKAAMVRLGIGAKKVWITEIGLAKTAYTLANMDKVADYPNVIQTACDTVGVNRWAWYIQKDRDGYFALQDSGGLTAVGTLFAGG